MKNLIAFFVFFTQVVFPQTKLLKGVVLDENLKPLSFANILLEDTKIGTATNSDGTFKLEIPAENLNGTLKISYVGFQTKEIKISEMDFSKKLRVVLKPAVLSSQTILVHSAIGEEGKTPIAFTKLDRKEIENGYVLQDVPEFLSSLPSVTFYSENGNGIGYNYLSIRGFDQRRITVSVNGIPQNDPEDHNVYWLDMPDLLGSAGLLQVQRGAGAGILGYPAIGGSINIITSPFSNKRNFKISTSYGSYNTRKYSATFSSGLINKKYSLYFKLSNILSSGYRENSWTNFKAYYLSAVRYDKDLTTQINIFGGLVADGLAYTGLPKWTIKNKQLRRENYSYWESDGSKYTWVTRRRPDEIENFFQPHFEILNDFKISKNVKFNSALFLLLGNGFFDYDGSWSVYYDDYFRLKQNGFDSTKIPTNALIRAMVENKQWGWIPRLSVKHKNGLLTVGLEYRNHRSVHWGSINYANNLPNGVTKNYRYYYYEGGKDILNGFVNENYNVGKSLSLLGEVQVAYHKYLLRKEKYVGNNFSISDVYFNPRLGLSYRLNEKVSSFLSFARVTREPRLKNYYDAAESSGGAVPQFKMKTDGSYDFTKPLVSPETMNDFETGVNFKNKYFNLSVNLFYMVFDNEIVKKGQVDRFGQPVTGNMERTIHSGAELSAVVRFQKYFTLTFNGSYSDNYISKGKRFVKFRNPKTGNKETVGLNLNGNPIAGFPNLDLSLVLKFKYRNLSAIVTSKYVGKFYSDNFGDKLNYYLSKYPAFVDYNDNVVEPYFVTDVLIGYENQNLPFFEGCKVFLQVKNVFNNLYAAYAIGKEFFPSAERNFIVGADIQF